MKLFRISINASIFFLILSGVLHSISFIVKQEPANDTEKQLVNLIDTYKLDMGAGFFRTFHQLFLSVSASFTLFLIFGGVMLYYLNKNNISRPMMKGILNIYLLFYGVLLIIVCAFAFLPPIVCVALVFVSLIFARWSVNSIKES